MKKAIYTAIIGDYDFLWQPKFVNPDWDYICFTDRPKLKSDTWKFVKVDPEKGLTPEKQSRKIKILAHEYMKEYGLTVWIDANIQPICNPEVLVKDHHFHKFNGFTTMQHPVRSCIYKEASICIDIGKGDKNEILDQISHYRNKGYPEQYGILPADGILIRNNTEKNQAINERWWYEVYHGSARDQLALPFTLWVTGTSVNFMPYDVIQTYFNYQAHKGKVFKK